MKFIAFLFLILVNKSCSQDKTNFIPKNFDYPDNKIGNGKTFVYKNFQTNKESFQNLRLINSEGYYSVTISNNNSIGDSLIIYNSKVIERYNFFMSGNSTITKGEKLLDTILNNNDKWGKYLTKWAYRTTQLLYTTQTEEKYIKDTIYEWQGQSLQCLVTQRNTSTIIQAINDTSLNHNTAVIYKFYYAKGIGIIKTTTEFTDHNGEYVNDTWTLESIREIH